MQILFDHAFMGIHQQNHNVCLVDGLQSFDDRKFLYRLFDILTPPNPRRVNQRIGMSVAFVLNENTVTRCPRLIEDHHSVLAQQAIDQGRLSHIGPAYHRNTNA